MIFRTRILALGGLILACVAAPVLARAQYPTMTLTITETPGAYTKSGNFTVNLGDVSETIWTGPNSTPSSIAADLGARFSEIRGTGGKLCGSGVCAKASNNVVIFERNDLPYFNSPTISIDASQWFHADPYRPNIPGIVPLSCSPVTVFPTQSPTCTASVDLSGQGSAQAPVTFAVSNASTGLLLDTLTATINQQGSSSYATQIIPIADLNSGNIIVVATYPGSLSMPVTVAVQQLQPQPMYTYSLQYGPNNEVQSSQDSVNGNWGDPNASPARYIQYDNFERLVGAVHQPVAAPAQYFCWNYDVFGNRLKQVSSDVDFSPTTGDVCNTSGSKVANVATYVTGGVGANRMLSTNAGPTFTTYGPNAPVVAGLTPSPDPAGYYYYDWANRYLYDGEGRICAVQSFQGVSTQGASVIWLYIYDADGRRVGKGISSAPWGVCDTSSSSFTQTVAYILGPNGEQLSEIAINSSGVASWTHTNVFGSGELIATYSNTLVGTGQPYYQLSDWLGTRRVQATSIGVPQLSYSSAPYGDMVSVSGAGLDATEQHFTGKERDAESGLDNFGARYFGSSMGRFMSPDWSSVPDTVPYADFNDPQTLNLYAYAGNNPVSYADAGGHTYHICDAQGQNCSDVSDKDFDQIIKNARTAGEYWVNGNISLSDGTAGGSYKQTDVDLPGDPAATQAAANMIGNGGTGMVNMFMQNMAYSVAGGLIAQGIGLGIEALADGAGGAINTGTNAVYRSVNSAGEVQYVGITNSLARRAGEHAGRFAIEEIPGLSNLSKADAKAVEQVLIETHGLASNGGTLLNRINSIASTNPGYAQALERGAQILQQVGYFK